MGIRRVAVVGSPDDGKSTLLGRIFVDGKQLKTDQYRDLTDSKSNELNLAFLCDGLRKEREKSITIDAAYKHLQIANVDFLVADCPGHFEYMRNAISAVSQSDYLMLIIDSKRGIRDQTLRHLTLANFFGITKTIICLNKMDEVGYSEIHFNNLKTQIENYCKDLSLNSVQVIPISALLGDNLFQKSISMNWYKGSTLVDELCATNSSTYCKPEMKIRMTVQGKTCDSDGNIHYYLYGNGAEFFKDEYLFSSSGAGSLKIKKLFNLNGDEIKVSTDCRALRVIFEGSPELKRGDVLGLSEIRDLVKSHFNAHLIWISTKELSQVSGRLNIQMIGTKAHINKLVILDNIQFGLQNTLVNARLELAKKVAIDFFDNSREHSGFVIMDSEDFECVAVGRCIEDLALSKISLEFPKVDKNSPASELNL